MTISYEVARGNLDTAILHALQTNPQTGHQLIHTLQEKLGIQFSAGTVYSKLYKLQRQGLVTTTNKEGKTQFIITDQGIPTLKENIASLIQMLKFLERGL